MYKLNQIIEVPEIINNSKTKTGIKKCQIVQLPKITDHRGNLTVIENNKNIPFEIKRVYYLYDVPGGVERGSHAHKNLQQLIVAISGSFDIIIDDGYHKKKYHLNRSYYGLYICPMVWREIINFSSGAVCMSLASDLYDESDYYRNYQDFMKSIKRQKLK